MTGRDGSHTEAIFVIASPVRAWQSPAIVEKIASSG
jgi:hypothetical protein